MKKIFVSGVAKFICAVICTVICTFACAQEDIHFDFCDSTPELIRTYEFLKQQKEVPTTEEQNLRVAEIVSEGCNGAGERFIEVILLLKKAGLSSAGSLRFGLDFSKLPKDVQKNFVEIFQGIYSPETYNQDYKFAVEMALKLSKEFKGSTRTVREDFKNFLDFCLGAKKDQLPMNLCFKVSLEAIQYNIYFESGVFSSFRELYEKLRNDNEYFLSIRDALQISLRVIQFGPRASQNFLTAYQFALSQKGLKMGRPQAFEIALKMASNSVTLSTLEIKPRP